MTGAVARIDAECWIGWFQQKHVQILPGQVPVNAKSMEAVLCYNQAGFLAKFAQRCCDAGFSRVTQTLRNVPIGSGVTEQQLAKGSPCNHAATD